MVCTRNASMASTGRFFTGVFLMFTCFYVVFPVCFSSVISFQGRAAILCSAASIHNTRSTKEREGEEVFTMTMQSSHFSITYCAFTELCSDLPSLFPLFWTFLPLSPVSQFISLLGFVFSLYTTFKVLPTADKLPLVSKTKCLVYWDTVLLFIAGRLFCFC